MNESGKIQGTGFHLAPSIFQFAQLAGELVRSVSLQVVWLAPRLC